MCTVHVHVPSGTGTKDLTDLGIILQGPFWIRDVGKDPVEILMVVYSFVA